MIRIVLASLFYAALLVGCSATPPPTANPGNTVTAIDSFGATPNPSPLNVGVSFSWTITGSNLTCTLDAEGDGTVDYTIQNCSSQSRVVHTYGAQGAFTARLSVSGADGQSRFQNTPVTVAAANLPPTIPTLQPQLVASGDPLEVTFVWSVDDRNSDITHCQFDADSDGVLEYDNLCSGLPATNAVKPNATVNHFLKYRYRSKGNYTATLEASDPYSSTISAVKVRAPLNSMPVINTLSATAGPNNTASLAFRVSDPDSDTLSCKLNVQSIGTFNYPNCRNLTRSFTFGNPGKYRATLEVSDGLQTASKTAVIDLSSPTPIVVQIAAGFYHNCVRTQDGNVWCWGKNDSGQMGNGVILPSFHLPTLPEKVLTTGVSGSKFVDLSAGAEFTCALRDDGTAWCWGKNNYGQLGDSTLQRSNVPIPVSTNQRFTAVSAGRNFVCAISQNGNVWCWGLNDSGQLGTAPPGNPYQQNPVPVQVSTTGVSGNRFTAVSAGEGHACGLRDNGSLWCWGGITNYTYYGELGDGTSNPSYEPVQVSGSLTGSRWTHVSAGSLFTCGVRDDASGWCWGANFYGNMGQTSDYIPHINPEAISGGGQYTLISARNRHTCGLMAGGIAYCWGYNNYGQIGNNQSGPSQEQPQAVVADGLSGTSFTQIATGYEFSCGLRDDHSVWCWGDNGDYGHLGTGEEGTRIPVPVEVKFPW